MARNGIGGHQAVGPGRRPGGDLLRGARQEDARAFTRANQPYHEVPVPRQARRSWRRCSGRTIRCCRRRRSGPRGPPYRVSVRGKYDLRYGMQIDLLAIRPATEADARDGYDFYDLVENSQIPPDDLLRKLNHLIEQHIDHPALRRLVETILSEHLDRVQEDAGRPELPSCVHLRPARARLEHDADRLLPRRPLRQVLRQARPALEPRDRDRGHDPARHRQAAGAGIPPGRGPVHEGRPAHRPHPDRAGTWSARPRAGSRASPRTCCSGWNMRSSRITASASSARRSCPRRIEALLVSHIDDLDAKMNIVARELMRSETSDGFTDRIYALDNRQFYKGLPEEVATRR